MNIEKLYQDVWAQVFALTWDRSGHLSASERAVVATNAAHMAAVYAVKLWEPSKAHAAIGAAEGLPPAQPEADAPEGE